MRARSKTKTQNPEADLATLDFLGWARYQLSQEPLLKVRMAGNSMSPTITDDELMLIEPITREKIAIGDIILYASLSDTAVIHRVLRLEETSSGSVIITRGDACDLDDVPAPSERVLGRVVSVERDGVAVALSEPRRSWWQRLLIRLRLK